MNYNDGSYDDTYLGQLPWPESQEVFAFGGPNKKSATPATIGWHGTDWDPMVHAFAIVRPDGPLAHLLGKRLKISYKRKAIYVFCHDTSNIIEDLSVTKRAFIDLASPALDDLHVTVEEMA